MNMVGNISKDINSMILKYYFIPNDHDWSQAIKKAKNDKFIGDRFSDHFEADSGCVIVNNDIFILGGSHKGSKLRSILKLDVATSILRRLTSIEYPSATDWYPTFCTKSQNIHLFDTSFDNHWSISLQTLNSTASIVLDP